MSPPIDRTRLSGYLPRAAPDGLLGATLLAFLATAGFFYVNIMPAVVSALVSDLHFSEREAGQVASANVYGAAIGAIVCVCIARAVSWRRLAVVLLYVLITVDLGCMFIISPVILMWVRFLHGIVGGTLVGTAFAVIARTRVPDRTFGVVLVVQFGLGGLALLLLSVLVPVWGAWVVFLLLALFSLVTLGALPFLSEYPPPVVSTNASMRQHGRGPGDRSVVMLALALLSLFLFQAGNTVPFAYIIELGRAYGLSATTASAIVAASGWVGMLGSLPVIASGLRWGRLRPLLAALLLASLGTAAFHLSAHDGVFAAANIVTSIIWAFCLPYLLGLCASFDSSGRAATLASFASELGLASGPMAGGLLVGSGNWSLLINVACIMLALSAIFAVIPARRLDRESDLERVRAGSIGG